MMLISAFHVAWRKPSRTINVSSLPQLNRISPPTVAPLQTSRKWTIAQIDTSCKKTVYMQPTLLNNFNRKVHNNRKQHGIGRIPHRAYRVSNKSAIDVLKIIPSKNCSFVNSRCFYCGVTGHIKVACRSRLAAHTSQ